MLAGNEELLRALDIFELDQAIGLRTGELLHCEYTRLGPGGCGTSHSCSKCGAVLALLSCQSRRERAEGECSLTTDEGGLKRTREFRVRCTPLTLGGRPVTIMILQDISAAKRCDALERVFFHDLRNVIHGLMGYSELATMGDTEVAAKMILALSNQLVEEIDGYIYLHQGEQRDLTLNRSLVDISKTLDKVRAVFQHHVASRGKSLETPSLPTDAIVETDERLLRRVLVNMVKNAFEAVSPGGVVELYFELRDGAPTFAVRNPGTIDDDIALQIFRRSFTTKGESGRGLGTYSMKLLGEQYLKGKVAFSSSELHGTEFSIRLPENSLVRRPTGGDATET